MRKRKKKVLRLFQTLVWNRVLSIFYLVTVLESWIRWKLSNYMLEVFRSNQKHRLVIIMFFLWKGYLIIIPIRRLLYGTEKNVKLIGYRKWSDFILKSLVRLKPFIHQVVRLHSRYRFLM